MVAYVCATGSSAGLRFRFQGFRVQGSKVLGFSVHGFRIQGVVIQVLASALCFQVSDFRVECVVEGDRIRRFLPSEAHVCACVCV